MLEKVNSNDPIVDSVVKPVADDSTVLPKLNEEESDGAVSNLIAQTRQGLFNLNRGIGEVSILMSKHPSFKTLFLSDIKRVILPPIFFNQYRIVRNQSNQTLGFVSWALVGSEALSRLMRGRIKLKTAEWQSGKEAVIMDVVAFTSEASKKMVAEILKTDLSQYRVWRINGEAKVHEPKLKQLSTSSFSIPEVNTAQ